MIAQESKDSTLAKHSETFTERSIHSNKTITTPIVSCRSNDAIISMVLNCPCIHEIVLHILFKILMA